MCNISDHVVLSETGKSRLSKCKCCGHYTMIFNNVYISFNDNGFEGFKNMLKNLSDDDFNKDHPNGEKNVLLKNNRTNMGVSLSPQEVYEVLEILREAELFEEVFSILYSK